MLITKFFHGSSIRSSSRRSSSRSSSCSSSCSSRRRSRSRRSSRVAAAAEVEAGTPTVCAIGPCKFHFCKNFN